MSPETTLNGGSLAQWGKLIAVVGVPSVIALFLVWVGATELPRIARETEANRVQAELHNQQLRDHKQSLDELTRLTRWVCAGVSKDDTDRRECFAK